MRPTVSFTLPASRLVWRAGAEELTLRPQSVQDAPAVHEAVNDSLPELRRHMAWAHYAQTLESQIERAKQAQADYWGGRDAIFVLWGQDGQARGCFGLHRRTLNPRGLEIGYWVRSRFAGRGYATEATKALIVYCFDHLRCTRVQCGANESNAASQRVQAKCGFVTEGRLRNFEPPGTDELRANGYVGGHSTFLTGLVPDDLAALPWLPGFRIGLQVHDWQGRLVPT